VARENLRHDAKLAGWRAAATAARPSTGKVATRAASAGAHSENRRQAAPLRDDILGGRRTAVAGEGAISGVASIWRALTMNLLLLLAASCRNSLHSKTSIAEERKRSANRRERDAKNGDVFCQTRRRWRVEKHLRIVSYSILMKSDGMKTSGILSGRWLKETALMNIARRGRQMAAGLIRRAAAEKKKKKQSARQEKIPAKTPAAAFLWLPLSALCRPASVSVWRALLVLTAENRRRRRRHAGVERAPNATYSVVMPAARISADRVHIC